MSDPNILYNQNNQQNQKSQKIEQKSKWNFRPKNKQIKRSLNDIVENFETDKIEDKMKKIKQKRQLKQPNKIPPFENIYETTNNSNQTSNKIIEGLTPGQSSSASPSSASSIFNSKFSSLKSGIEQNYNSAKAFNLDTLWTEISNIEDDISKINGANIAHYAQDFAVPTTNTNFKINLQTLNLNVLGEQLKLALTQFTAVITNIFNNLATHLLLFNKLTQAFILSWNQNVTIVISKIANALTQNTATVEEISIFQTQVTTFLTILMVWIFIYNWYYVAFFLEDRDNIRYTLNSLYTQDADGNMTSTIANSLSYFFIGPCCEVVRLFNKVVVEWPSKFKQSLSPFMRIFILPAMFFIFLILVTSNYQMVILTDFFNSLKWSYGTSIFSLFVLLIVFGYGLKFFWSNENSPVQWSSNNIISTIFKGICILLSLFIYLGIMFLFQMPLAMILISAYLVMNSFFAIFWYEGFNIFNILPAISEEMSFVGADLTTETFAYIYEPFTLRRIPLYCKHYAVRFFKYLSAYLFEILLFFVLLGGIGTYLQNFQSTLAAKSAMSSLSNTSISGAFKQLFTWLILFNIILIILLVLFMVQKYKDIQAIQLTPTELKETLTRGMSSGMGMGRGIGPGMGMGPAIGGSSMGPAIGGSSILYSRSSTSGAAGIGAAASLASSGAMLGGFF